MRRRTFVVIALLATLLDATAGAGQITRHPTGVNVNATAPTSVFITFGNLGAKVPVEAFWCGSVVPAAPQLGQRCAPGTLFGRLPIRYDQSRASGTNGFTDVMTIPASVARRAYQSAAEGGDSRFYYVRRFVDPRGGPDEFVTVTCRMTDGGARTPFSLLDVQVTFETAEPVLSIPAGEVAPPVQAALHYNGTGRLRGRWEVVRPGEDLPEMRDLLTEATLPLEERRRQRRYTEVSRFDVFLPPGGSFILPGPPADRLPTDAPGSYLLLLRVEATDDKEGDSDLRSAGAGSALVHSGGLAGFPLPPLRYLVGQAVSAGTVSDAFRLLTPSENAPFDVALPTRLAWTAHLRALYTRLEIAGEEGELLLEVVLPRDSTTYELPARLPLLEDASTRGGMRWRAVALGAGGRPLQATSWRVLGATPNPPSTQR